MKHAKIFKNLFVLFAVVLCFGPVGLAEPVGTAFTYQGRLIDNNQPANGLYDLQFKLYDAASDGNQLFVDVNSSETQVNDGSFVVELDFGNVFDGNNRWLEIGVRPGDQSDPCAYSLLSPRQKVTPTPYALYALNGGGAGGGSPWQVNGTSIYYNNGNVGIGTTSPGYKLDVQGGDISASGNLRENGTALLSKYAYVGGSNASGSWPINAATVTNGVYTTGSYADPTWLNSLAGSKITGNISGNATGISGNISASQVNTGTFQNGAYTFQNSVNFPGSGIWNASGNVGIGTTSPAAKLEVAGQVKINGGSPGSGKVLTSDASGLAIWQPPVSIPDGDPKVGSATANRVPKWNGSTLVDGTIYDNGNIGIGTTSPSSKLSVNGDINTTSGYMIGGNTVLSLAPGTGNTFVGLSAGGSTGNWNTFSGYNAGSSNTGSSNTFLGSWTGYFGQNTGSENTFLGSGAGYHNTTGYNNTFSGYNVGYSNTTGYFNTFSGWVAGAGNTTGIGNTFSGAYAGNHNTEGNYNTFLGYMAGLNSQTSSGNVSIGYMAGDVGGPPNQLGSGNVSIGYMAGGYVGNPPTQTGSNNVFIGYMAGYNETGSNKLYIANNTPGALIYGDFSANTLGFGTTSIPAGYAINTATGAYLTTGGTWTNNSSRDVKENITPVDTRQVLEKLVSVPVSTWNYKVEDQCNRHVGPMAQDFYEAFGLNDSDTSIATIDTDGISLAAIQGLYQIVKEENAALKKENEEIKARLAAMESQVAKLSLQQEGGIK